MHNARKRLLAGPYLVWIIGFTVLPILMILYYAFTNSDGGFTWANIAAIADPVHIKALLLSLKLGILCTVVCLLLACHDIKQSSYQASELCGIYLRPANVDEFYAAYFSMADVTFQ